MRDGREADPPLLLEEIGQTSEGPRGGGVSCGTSQLARRSLWINREMSSELWGFFPNLAEVQLTGKVVYS